MLFESKLNINEELSIADNAVKLSRKISDKCLEILPKVNLERSIEYYRYFKRANFDVNTNGLIPKINVLHISLFVYCFDNNSDYRREKNALATNCEADFDTQTITLRLVTIDSKPNDEFDSSIQHEVNHIFQYANGASKNESLYDRVIKVNNGKEYSDDDRIIAYAIYLTFKTEQDSFVNQYYAYLKQNNVCDDQIFNYFPEDDGNPYNQFLDLYDRLDNLQITDKHLIETFGINKKQLFLRLNNADKRIRNKLIKAAIKYRQELRNEQQKHSCEVSILHNTNYLNYLLESIKKGIHYGSSEFDEL